MDVKTKALFSLISLLVILAIATSYYRFFVLHDYETFYDDYGEEETLEAEMLIE